jgi:hypothetical protein
MRQMGMDPRRRLAVQLELRTIQARAWQALIGGSFGPTRLAVVLALLSWPFVVLALHVMGAVWNLEPRAPLVVELAALSAVLTGGLVGGSLGGRLIGRRSPLVAVPLTAYSAWVGALVGTTLLPAVFAVEGSLIDMGQHFGTVLEVGHAGDIVEAVKVVAVLHWAVAGMWLPLIVLALVARWLHQRPERDELTSRWRDGVLAVLGIGLSGWSALIGFPAAVILVAGVVIWSARLRSAGLDHAVPRPEAIGPEARADEREDPALDPTG